MDYTDLFSRHEKIALQCSGGKDSLACLHLLKDYWPKLTVYFLNSGDAFPETLAVINNVARTVPNFVEVKGNVHGVHTAFGIPSDIVPASSTAFAHMIDVNADKVMITDRYTCCAHSIMYPLHQRMLDDGITLIIRGQKACDSYKSPALSGAIIDHLEFFFPLENWTDKEVYEYIVKHDIALPLLYDDLTSSADCLTCTAWLSEGRGKYLNTYHPKSHVIYMERLNAIADAAAEHAENFRKELA